MRLDTTYVYMAFPQKLLLRDGPASLSSRGGTGGTQPTAATAPPTLIHTPRHRLSGGIGSPYPRDDGSGGAISPHQVLGSADLELMVEGGAETSRVEWRGTGPTAAASSGTRWASA